jgi:hypothetical protein
MPPIVLIHLVISLVIAATIFGGATFCLVYLVWAFLGRRGPARSRRLRLALASALVSAAAVLAAVAITYLYTLPSSMSIIRPDYRAPYQILSRAAAMTVPLLIFLAAALAIRAAFREPGFRRRQLQFSLMSVILAAAVGVAGYWLIYSVQVPAFERFVMIESRDWSTQIGEQAPNAGYRPWRVAGDGRSLSTEKRLYLSNCRRSRGGGIQNICQRRNSSHVSDFKQRHDSLPIVRLRRN